MNLGLSFGIEPIHSDESRQKGEIPEDYAKRITRLKLGSENSPENTYIASDTIVYTRKEFFFKPADINEAEEMLLNLVSLRKHYVLSSIGIDHFGNFHYAYEITEVHFRNWGRKEIREYIQKYSPLDKAGSYGIQDFESPVLQYQGSLTNVIGFPIRSFFKFHEIWSEYLVS